jgi:hypothetical protein
MMDTQPPLPGGSGPTTGRLVGTTSNMNILSTQHECRHKLVQRDAANTATKHINQDVNLNIIRKSGSSKHQKQHVVGCKSIHIVAMGDQFTI